MGGMTASHAVQMSPAMAKEIYILKIHHTFWENVKITKKPDEFHGI